MRARREREVAHAALVALRDRAGVLDPATYEGLLGVAVEFTAPRRWWWPW